MNRNAAGHSSEGEIEPGLSSKKPKKSSSVDQLAYREVMDRKTFLRDHLKAGKPVIIKGALEAWYKTDVWNFEWFRDQYHDLAVPLRYPASPESGEKTGFEIKSGSLGNYLQQLLAQKPVEECGYLASLPLKSLPEIQQVAVFPDYRWVDRMSAAAAWLGPAGTESVLHCDLVDNMLAQVRGRKLFQLYPPGTIDPSGSRQHNSLTADPRYRESPPAPEYEFVLEEGEVLYLPPFYWHRVVSLEPSISVNLAWYTPRTTLRDALRILTALARSVVRRLRRIVRAVWR